MKIMRLALIGAMVVLFGTFFSGCSRSFGPPMTVYKNFVIPDGEYLDYQSWEKGSLYAHYHMVTRHEKGADGKLMYRTSMEIIPVNGTRKLDPDYKKWSMQFLVDASTGAVVDNVGTGLTPDQSINFANIGVAGVISWDYKLKANGVEYTTKQDVQGVVKDRNFVVPFDTKYPSGDMLFGLFFKTRLLDAQNDTAVYYTVCPHLIKDASPESWAVVSPNESIVTELGKFDSTHYALTSKDPVISKALAPLGIRGQEFWIQNSDQRLMVNMTTVAGKEVLEKVSNVLTEPLK